MSSHLDYLFSIAQSDVEHIKEKEKTYQGSWKKRGGCGAFHMLARKWDRLENMLGRETHILNRSRAGQPNLTVERYDVFAAVEADATGGDGTVLAEVRDLRRYLLLVEAEMAARSVIRTGPLATEPPLNRQSLNQWSTSGLRAQLIDLGRSPLSRVGDALARDIRAELARRGAKWREEPNRPGTPEDGGHHARQNIVPGGGAFDMKVGDRVVCTTPGHTYYGRTGVAKEFLQDGDAYVQLDGESGHTMIKWNHLSKAP
jgi:hypothetical protein